MRATRLTYLAAVLVAAIFAGAARGDVPGPITTRVDNLLSAGGGTTGLYLKRVGGPVLAAKNESFAFEPASSIKVLIHLYAMQQVQNGLSLATPIPQYAEPVPPSSCPGDATGTTEPLGDALQRMMRVSNNAATKELMIYLGVANLQALGTSLGLTSTHFQLSASPPGFNVIGCQASGAVKVDDNTTSLVDLGKIYEGVADSSLLSGPYREGFFERMAGKEMFEEQNFDFTQVWVPRISQIVDDETPPGMYFKKVNAFVNAMRENAKGGGYGKCLTAGCTTFQEWLIMAGWIQIPVCDNGQFSNVKDVWGVFIDGAVDPAYFDQKVTPADMAFGNADAEPLREQIHDALAGWDDCFEKTPPTITLAVDPSDHIAPSGWYNVASSGTDGVLAHFTATDPSGIDFFICSGKQDIPTIDHVLHDLDGTIFCTARDGLGNQAIDVPFPFKIDQTPPTVTCPATPAFVLGGPGGTVTAAVTDAMSGATAATVSAAADVSSAGPKTASLTGHDAAGNSTTVACPYVVGYNVLGFFSPLPKQSVNSGSKIPVKLALANAAGTTIPDAESQALEAACGVTVEITGGAPVCMSYHSGSNRFQAELEAIGPPGPATILAEVTVGGQAISQLSTGIVLK